MGMFRHLERRRDIERDPRGSGEEILNFEDSDWILDHHRHNLIQKIVKPERFSGVLATLWGKVFARNTQDQNNQNQTDQNPRDEQSQEIQKHEIHQLAQDVQPGTENPSYGQLEDSRESYRINFCELQRMHLRQLQYKLVDHVVNLTYGGKEPSGWAEDLRNYEPAASHTILVPAPSS